MSSSISGVKTSISSWAPAHTHCTSAAAVSVMLNDEGPTQKWKSGWEDTAISFSTAMNLSKLCHFSAAIAYFMHDIFGARENPGT